MAKISLKKYPALYTAIAHIGCSVYANTEQKTGLPPVEEDGRCYNRPNISKKVAKRVDKLLATWTPEGLETLCKGIVVGRRDADKATRALIRDFNRKT